MEGQWRYGERARLIKKFGGDDPWPEQ